VNDTFSLIFNFLNKITFNWPGEKPEGLDPADRM
jgi:hypothetical protein